jgi:hypothetical protein
MIIESSAGSNSIQRAELLTCSIYSILDVRAECIYSGSLGEKGVHRVSFPKTGGERERERREGENERERERGGREGERERKVREGDRERHIRKQVVILIDAISTVNIEWKYQYNILLSVFCGAVKVYRM